MRRRCDAKTAARLDKRPKTVHTHRLLRGLDRATFRPSCGVSAITGECDMAEGTIKRLTDKGFGFIANASGTDMFFHMSAVEGVRFEDLREGEKVYYNEGRGPKGQRA